ncbi:MAG: Rrf2 family transcriptional regulator [Deltaproteobacteria bacterium]|nr:Rrf2 family transcriptional regulator [Candidatus Zymogenaceae bacterium]
MSNIIKISEAASIALHVMVLLARERPEGMNAKTMAEVIQVSEAHLAKVLQRLARADLVISTRGPRGGFTLNGDPKGVTLLMVYEAVEGALEPAKCLFTVPVCRGDDCIFGTLLREKSEEIRRYMGEKTLDQLTGIYGG